MNAPVPDIDSVKSEIGGFAMDTHPAGSRMLVVASAVLLAGVALHGVDHALQERGIGALSTAVSVGGVVNAAVALLVFALAVRDHPRAPLVAAVVGAYLVAGVSAAHFAPRWGALSDPYAELDLGFASWAAAIAEVGAAAVLAAVGVAVLRQRRVMTA
jgi:hypothetical protein